MAYLSKVGGLYLSLKKKESKNGCMVFTSSASSLKEEVRQFRVVVVQRRQEKKRGERAKSLFYQSNPIAFLPVLLLSLNMFIFESMATATTKNP